MPKSDTFANGQEDDDSEKYLDDIMINNSSNSKQDSIIVEDADVRPNDHKVLEVLGEDRSRYTFRGLMRKLCMHQETLSRALRRLDELGLVEKSELGYRLSMKGEFVARMNDTTRPSITYTPLLQTYIPSNVDVRRIVASLAGRWFKNLRWLGMVDGETDQQMLQWISEDGSFQVNLRIVGNYIIIETNANTEKEKVAAMVSAYRIFEHLSRLYGGQHGGVFSYTFSNENPAN